MKRSSSVPDVQHMKALRSNSNLTVPGKGGSTWLTLVLEDGRCVVYNPDEGKIKKSLEVLSETRFLATYGNWVLMLDLAKSSIYIVDVFSETRINLPPLESCSSLKRVEGRDREFIWEFSDGGYCELTTNNLRGRFWVNGKKAQEFLVAWYFDGCPGDLFVCKRGDVGYTVIPLRDEVPKLYNGLIDLVLWGYRIYISTTRRYIRVIDVSSGEQGFKDVSRSPPVKMRSPFGVERATNIAVTTSGEVMLVVTTTRDVEENEDGRSFRFYKMDPEADPEDNTADLLEVDSLGDEALFLDLGITVPANHTLGIKPNSVYFTQHYHTRFCVPYKLDICVYDLATKTIKRFPDLANFNLKDARWFLPLA